MDTKAKRLIIVAISILLVIYLTVSYNTMAKQNQAVLSSWGQVQNQYQRRMDLVPNLVNIVKGEANFEKSTLTEVINSRAKATQTNITPAITSNQEQLQQFKQIQDKLGSSLSRLMVSVEKYPDLKTNQQFSQLMDELAGTENRIAVARRDYNNTVQSYNANLITFPHNLLAKLFGFSTKAYFQSDSNAEKAPVINFSS